MPTADRRVRIKRHAIRRARERWGAFLTVEDIGVLNAVIRSGLGRLIQRRSSRCARKFFVTTLDWITIPVVYNDKANCIVTVLPASAKEVQRALAKRAILVGDAGALVRK